MFESLMLFVGGTEMIILVVVIGVLIFGAAENTSTCKDVWQGKI